MSPLAFTQALHEPNPASHLIWWIAGASLVVLGVIVLVELIDWLRERSAESPPGAEPPRRFWRLRDSLSWGVKPRERLWPWGDRQPRERRVSPDDSNESTR